jgi:hypothetical protein
MASRLSLLTIVLLAGCAVDAQIVIPPLPEENPRVRLPLEMPDDARLVVHTVYRSSRGGVLALELTNTGEKPLQFCPRQIDVQLSSGYRRRFINATEFKRLCAEFGPESYGLNTVETIEPWEYAEEGTRYTLQSGQSQQLLFPFGARADETFIVLDLDPALQRARHFHPPGKLRIAVELPHVSPSRQSVWPEWLHVGFVFTNAG